MARERMRGAPHHPAGLLGGFPHLGRRRTPPAPAPRPSPPSCSPSRPPRRRSGSPSTVLAALSTLPLPVDATTGTVLPLPVPAAAVPAVPGVGRITLDCESLTVPDDDQTLVVYSAAPSGLDADKLELVRALPSQP